MTLIALPFLILIVALTLSVVAFAPGQRPGDPRVAAIRRRILRSRLASVAISVLAAVALGAFVALNSGRVVAGFLAIPFVFAIVWLVLASIVEGRVYRPLESGTAAAGLAHRNWREYVPGRLTAATGVGIVAVFAIIGVAYANTAGDSLRIECVEPATSAGYGSLSRAALVGMVGGFVVAALLAAVAVRAAVMRRRPDAAVIAAAEDDAVRRSSSHAAVGVVAGLVALCGAVLALVIGDGLGSLADVVCAPGWWGAASTILAWSQLAWLALFVWAVVAIGDGGRVRSRNFEAMT